MSIIAIIVVLVVIGLILWLINTYVPMPPVWKRVIIVVAVCLVIYWLLSITGIWAALMQATI